MFLTLRLQLRGKESRQQVSRDAVLDHREQLVVQESKFVRRVPIRVQSLPEFLIFFVEDISEGAQQGILSFKIVIEGTP